MANERRIEAKLSIDGSQLVTDERINTISHLVGSCLAFFATVLLVVLAIVDGNVWKIVGFSIYGFSLLVLFIFSTLHHGLRGGPKVSEVMKTFDYNAVFLLIAGTVTPLILILYRDLMGWIVLSVIWAIAITGITLRSVFRKIPKYVTNTMYITLGWLPVSLVLYENKLSIGGLTLLAAGGLVYTLGFAIFVAERPNFVPGKFGFHELWHVLVVLAAMLHFCFMYAYLLPSA